MTAALLPKPPVRRKGPHTYSFFARELPIQKKLLKDVFVLYSQASTGNCHSLPNAFGRVTVGTLDRSDCQTLPNALPCASHLVFCLKREIEHGKKSLGFDCAKLLFRLCAAVNPCVRLHDGTELVWPPSTCGRREPINSGSIGSTGTTVPASLIPSDGRRELWKI